MSIDEHTDGADDDTDDYTDDEINIYIICARFPETKPRLKSMETFLAR